MTNPYKRIKELESEIERIKTEQLTAKELLARLIGTDLEWYDYTKLSLSDWQTYYEESQKILRSKVFISEINKIIIQLEEWTLKKSPDFQAVRDMRMQVSGLLLLKERLEEIEDPNNYQTKNNINDVM